MGGTGGGDWRGWSRRPGAGPRRGGTLCRPLRPRRTRAPTRTCRDAGGQIPRGGEGVAPGDRLPGGDTRRHGRRCVPPARTEGGERESPAVAGPPGAGGRGGVEASRAQGAGAESGSAEGHGGHRAPLLLHPAGARFQCPA